MIRKYIAIFSLFLLLTPVAYAEGNIIFSIPQKDYYFLVGEQAYIPLNITNSGNNDINGILGYTLTQEINSGSVHFSSSNSKSTNLQVSKGNSTVNLGFGTSDKPETLNVSLNFNYDDNGSKVVNLGNIAIHFVEKESDKQNQANPIQSSSQEASTTQQTTDPFAQQEQQIAQQEQQMQQIMQQMTNQQSSQTPQQAAQNNQPDQNTSALKEQMQKQVQKQQETQQQFQKQVVTNQNFQKANQKLSDLGYNLTSMSANPSSNNTGTFTASYEKQNGDKASIQGEMNNGTMKSLQTDTAEDKQKMRDLLSQNKDFQKYLKQLQDDGFNEVDSTFSQENNTTALQIQYENAKNETAQINAKFENGSVEDVELVREQERNLYPIYLIGILILLVLAYLVYNKYSGKKEQNTLVEEKIPLQEENFDFREEAEKLVEKAISLYEEKQFKEAYGTAAQALRLYLSYKYGLKKEVTNAELINYLKNKGVEYEKFDRCLQLSSLVEFAKHMPDDGEFEEMIETIKDTMKDENK
ncbi:hypothetical protein A9239_08160 [Methanosarcina sp. A14]|uniref:TPR repeat containing protein n=1 Tax=Methanosarcina barkeri MS TaxID=1434108 RepID=A0A0E3QSX6_METBA|nr:MULTISPECIES: hypothetical protein [Methanosarcina]AKB53612.1 TPR repeat containing protein [Methanosarcina barkeri MS]OED09657.1 hypothetical protein A9239_08160 [Methanosarcina sp. A14]